MLAFTGYLKILLCLRWLYRHFASWAMSHRHRLLRQCQNTALPSLAISILCLLNYLPLGLLCLLGLPLELLCLLGCFASWATLLLGLLCLLGYFASWAALPLGLLCLLGCFASWACFLGYLSALCHLGHVSSTLSTLTMPIY
jgi:hypothetical protein